MELNFKFMGNNLDFYRLPSPHNCRRASWHDYKGPGWYLITLSKTPAVPAFSRIAGSLTAPENPPHCDLYDLGHIIDSQVASLDADPIFEIPTHVIMPDHVHLLWRVREWLPKDLGYYVGLFKSRCTKIWREQSSRDESLFMPKFNDRISFDDYMTRRFHNYIDDNPRRRLIVRSNPELFQSAQHIKIADRIMDCYGNFQLLKNPVIAPAIVSSRYTAEERARSEFLIEEAIRTQGVLISPFISQAEKALMHRAIDEGAI